MGERKIKMVLLGAASVGKTSIVNIFVKKEFSRFTESTIGAAFVSHDYELENGEKIHIDLWDTAGQERYEAIAPMYYRNAHGAIVMLDITCKPSFSRSKKWVKVLKRDLGDVTIVLCGNKCDLEKDRKVQKEDVDKYIKEQDLIYMETSAKTGHNVLELFQLIGGIINEKLSSKSFFLPILG